GYAPRRQARKPRLTRRDEGHEARRTRRRGGGDGEGAPAHDIRDPRRAADVARRGRRRQYGLEYLRPARGRRRRYGFDDGDVSSASHAPSARASYAVSGASHAVSGTTSTSSRAHAHHGSNFATHSASASHSSGARSE
ncbi:hypothetical protein K438DRAFT_2017526, partial [Mycena galopus ATCC 62051]